MATLASQTAGGKATAIILRATAIKKYNENPKICLNCKSIISIRDNEQVSSTKRKIFCSIPCAASYNNKKKIKPAKHCLVCGKAITRRATHCGRCRPRTCKLPINYVGNRTKGELFANKKNWQSARGCICRNAERVFNNSRQPRKCIICGYDKHVEICHKKGVCKFPGTSLISEINALTNLVPFCRNHHWEFDKDILQIPDQDQCLVVKKPTVV